MKRFLSLLLTMFLILSCVDIRETTVQASDYSIGVDISENNASSNWNVASSNVDFVIIRCGTGVGSQFNFRSDTKFVSNYNGAVSAEIPVGAYFYTFASTKEAMKYDVDQVLSILGNRHLDLPVYLDLEHSGPANVEMQQEKLNRSQLTELAIYGCNLLRNAGYKAGVYANKDWFSNRLNPVDIRNAGYETWIAHYTSKNSIDYSDNYNMWQYTSNGTCQGIGKTSEGIDMNVRYTALHSDKDTRYPTPFKSYPNKTDGKTQLYDVNNSPYDLNSRYIEPQDLCTITCVYTNGFVDVTYPTANGKTNSARALLSSFVSNAIDPYGMSPPENVISYTRSDMSEQFGEVYVTDPCTAVGVIDNRLQIIYPVSNGYKLGWIYYQVSPADTIPPVISGVSFSHITKDGFRVEIDVTDNVGLNRVLVPVWSHQVTDGNPQDDLVWHEATQYTDSHWYCDVALSEHKYNYGKYAVDIYAYDESGNTDIWHSENNKRSTAIIGEFNLICDANGGTMRDGTTYYSPQETDPELTFGSVSYCSLKWLSPSRKGYTFTGWYTEPTGGIQVYDSNNVCTNEGIYWSDGIYQNWGDLTVYAQWEPNQYTLTIDPNGGSYDNSMTTTQKSPNLIYDSSNWHYIGGNGNAIKDYCVLTGYYDAETGGTLVYDANGSCVNEGKYFQDGNYIYDGDLTVYAQWDLIENSFKGSGTKNDPYRITSKEDLVKMRDLVNDKALTSVFGNACYRQTADIDLENERWIPIGKFFENGEQGAMPNFKGTYDGDFHSIKGLYVSETDKFAGLFGHIDGGGTVENLEVYGTVLSEGDSAGGVVGEICNATIRNCAFYGDVKASGNTVGGILGFLWQCGTVENCYQNGTVMNTSSCCAGGVVGTIQTGKESDENAYVRNCYHIGEIQGASDYCGSVVGYISEMTEKAGRPYIENCYGVKKDATVVFNGTATASDVWLITDNQLKASSDDLGRGFVADRNNMNGGYPVLRIVGDANNDRVLSVADVVILQRYLLAYPYSHIADWIAVDLCEDGKLDVFDLCLLKRKILNA